MVSTEIQLALQGKVGRVHVVVDSTDQQDEFWVADDGDVRQITQDVTRAVKRFAATRPDYVLISVRFSGVGGVRSYPGALREYPRAVARKVRDLEARHRVAARQALQPLPPNVSKHIMGLVMRGK